MGHSSQLSAKLARSFPSRKKGYVPPPRVLADELDEGRDAWERIHAKVIFVTKVIFVMGEEIFGFLDTASRVDRISKEAKYKTFVDEMREVRDAVELGDYEFVEQRIDSPRMKQWLLTDTCSRRYRH